MLVFGLEAMLMFPVIALGAAILGGLSALSAGSSSSESSGSSRSSRSSTPNVSPQSYIVTPVSGGAGGQTISAVEAVQRFTV